MTSDYARLKHCAYRFALKNSHKVTPSSTRRGMQKTWAAWFEERFGETLTDYHNRVLEHKKARELVREQRA